MRKSIRDVKFMKYSGKVKRVGIFPLAGKPVTRGHQFKAKSGERVISERKRRQLVEIL